MLIKSLQENNTGNIYWLNKFGKIYQEKKIGIEHVTVTQANEHSFQKDSSSCGLYICKVITSMHMMTNVLAVAFF